METNYYKLLQCDSKAEPEVLKAAYHALVKKYREQNDFLLKLNAAAEVVLDEDRRRKYDVPKPVGKVVGDYRILAKLAEGGFGTTYKAEHITLGTPVCIKHAHDISPTDEAILLDEARSIWDLRHWGIPAIRDILKMPDDSLALVMSYVPGPTLAQIVEKKGAVDAEHVAWITERILNILKYIHLHGVIHGDMKPQNVIIQPESHTVVLVDYGLSAVKPHRKTEAKGYTPLFAAPEQVDGRPPIPEMDLYGLGMTMLFVLGGDIKRMDFPKSIPTELTNLIKRFVRLDPRQRPQVWNDEDLCETIQDVRKSCFGRKSSAMRPLLLD